MSNPPENPNPGEPSPDGGGEAWAKTPEQLAAERQVFVGELVAKELISQEFADSGALDSFGLDAKTDSDSVKHILIGDRHGGAHHLTAIMDLEVPGRTIASQIHDPADPDRKPKKYRDEQKMKENGTYHPTTVIIKGDDYEKNKTELGGSNMFPDEWSSEKVLQAVLDVSQNEADEYDSDDEACIHRGFANGIKVRVITDAHTHKITTGYPG